MMSDFELTLKSLSYKAGKNLVVLTLNYEDFEASKCEYLKIYCVFSAINHVLQGPTSCIFFLNIGKTALGKNLLT